MSTSFEEMQEIVDALFEEAEATMLKVENILDRAPIMNEGDLVVDELRDQFEAAANAFEGARGDLKGFDEIIAVATKVRDTSLAWAPYIEAIASPAGLWH